MSKIESKKKTIKKTPNKTIKRVHKTKVSIPRLENIDDPEVVPLAAAVPSVFFTFGSLHALPPSAMKKNGIPGVNNAGSAWECKEILPSPVVDVTASQFGSNAFDGVADNSAQFQAAVNALVPTGGTIIVPSNKKYVVGNVTIASQYPINIVSDMGDHILGGGNASTWNEYASIRPPLAGCSFIFKWERHATLTFTGSGAGGAIEGLNFADIDHLGASNPNRDRSITTAAVWFEDATKFYINRCQFQWLMGAAIKVGETTYGTIVHTKIYNCGSTAAETPASKPSIDLGGQDSQCYVWMDWVFIEASYNWAIKTTASTSGVTIHCINSYFEAGNNPGVGHIDGTNARLILHGNSLFATDATSVIAGVSNGTGEHEIIGNTFANFPSAGTFALNLLGGAVHSRIVGNQFITAVPNAATPSVWIQSHWNVIESNLFIGANIYNGGIDNAIVGNLFYAPIYQLGAASATAAAIHSVFRATVNSNHIAGATVSQCIGIVMGEGVCNGNYIHHFAASAGTGIVCNAADCVVSGNIVSVVNTPYTWFGGITASGNRGFTRAATAAAGAVTLNAESGIITTEALTTVAGADYTLTFTNALITANSEVEATIYNGTNTIGPIGLRSITPGAGSVSIVIRNNHASSALNGTLKINFRVTN